MITLRSSHARGHDTPDPISNVDIAVNSSTVQDGVMTANVVCRNCTGRSGGAKLNAMSTKQPWIWAVGPGKAVASDAQDANIDQHANYGS